MTATKIALRIWYYCHTLRNDGVSYEDYINRKEIDNLEKVINESLLKAEAIRQSILKQAIEGRLFNGN